MSRHSFVLDSEQQEAVEEFFSEEILKDGNPTISINDLDTALRRLGLTLTGFEVRDLIKECDQNGDGFISKDEFMKVYQRSMRNKDFGHQFKKMIKTRQGMETVPGSQEGTTHTVKDGELTSFTDWINSNLKDDPDCLTNESVPLRVGTDDLYKNVKDGILLCKLINHSAPDTIDERTINKPKGKTLDVYRRTENVNLALSSAASIGCNVVNIGPLDIDSGKPHLILGLVWQIIRIGLLSDVNLTSHPGLVLLLEEGESISDLMKLSPEQILLRWVNYHLRNAGVDKRISNFSSDIKDSEAYTYLLHQIAPKESDVTLQPLNEGNEEMRAEAMLMESDKIDCRAFVTSTDVTKGNAKLNLAFVANLFNKYPALDQPVDEEVEIIDETREEKTYRNWMNSMGVKPFVNYLYEDLKSGEIFFQLYDVVRPRIVNWSKVHQKFSKLKAKFEQIENCNYVVDLGKECHFSLVGIDGINLHDGDQTPTLALVWQLMRAYTLSILSKISGGKVISDAEIYRMAAAKLQMAGKKCTFSSLSDKSLCDSMAILELIDAIKPGRINYDFVKTDASTEEELLSNAKYAISMGRKIGARIYALPEDITEVKTKMVMTIFACLLSLDYELNKRQEQEEEQQQA